MRRECAGSEHQNADEARTTHGATLPGPGQLAPLVKRSQRESVGDFVAGAPIEQPAMGRHHRNFCDYNLPRIGLAR
jgi:hypothetical protein